MKETCRNDTGTGMKTIFLCEREPDDIFTAIYDAWASGLGHDNVEIEIEREEFQPRLFARYVSVQRNLEKAEKVARSVSRKISPEVYQEIYQAAIHYAPDRADAIYRFLILGFQVGRDVIHRLQEPAVCRVFELSRKAGREAHYFIEFARFAQWDNGVLFGKLAPKCNVLALVAPHFNGRLSGENWILYDEVYHKAAVHPARQHWYMVDTTEQGWEETLHAQDDGQEWENLWRTFVRTIAIEARINPELQQNVMPLWYRKNMTEHQKMDADSKNVRNFKKK